MGPPEARDNQPVISESADSIEPVFALRIRILLSNRFVKLSKRVREIQ